MAYNLFVSYDLMNWNKNYEGVQQRIRELGRWYRFQFSFFYVSSQFTPKEAHDHIRSAMDADDKLVVLEATSGVVSHYPPPDIEAVNIAWYSP